MTLPSFIIVGAAKSGTTSLYYYLMQHPNIYMPKQIKETNFLCKWERESYAGYKTSFIPTEINSIDEYHQLFHQADKQHKAIGEASNAYLYFNHLTIPRMLEVLGKDIKIIISLRNPVERAYSNYLHTIRDNIETGTFEDALQAESWRKNNHWWWGYLHTDVGFYADQVQAYIDVFGKEQVFTFLYDDLENTPLVVLKKLFRFLEIDEQFKPNMSTKYNATGVPKNKWIHQFLSNKNFAKSLLRPFVSQGIRVKLNHNLLNWNLDKPQIKPTTRRSLIELYRADTARLQQLIGRDLSHWQR